MDAQPMMANTLTGLYVDELRALGVDPPEQIKARVGRAIKQIINEGKAPEQAVTLAVRRLASRGLQPSALPGLVVEAQLELRRQRSSTQPGGHRCATCGAVFTTEQRLADHDQDVHAQHDPDRMRASLPELEKIREQVWGGAA